MYGRRSSVYIQVHYILCTRSGQARTWAPYLHIASRITVRRDKMEERIPSYCNIQQPQSRLLESHGTRQFSGRQYGRFPVGRNFHEIADYSCSSLDSFLSSSSPLLFLLALSFSLSFFSPLCRSFLPVTPSLFFFFSLHSLVCSHQLLLLAYLLSTNLFIPSFAYLPSAYSICPICLLHHAFDPLHRSLRLRCSRRRAECQPLQQPSRWLQLQGRCAYQSELEAHFPGYRYPEAAVGWPDQPVDWHHHCLYVSIYLSTQPLTHRD